MKLNNNGSGNRLYNFTDKKIIWWILGFLIVSNIFTLSIYLYKTGPNSIKNFKNPFPLIDPARSIVAQEHFFSTIEPVRQKMKDIVAKYEKEGNRIGVYFEFLNTGANVSINQDERFWPASLSKMPTVMAAMKKIENGEWSMDNELVLFPDDKDDRFGNLYKESVGTRFTIETLLKEVLINSDNTAHRMLVRNLTSENYTDMFKALGMEQLYNEDYDITAKEYSRIFRSLYNASYLNRANSQLILEWLSVTSFDDLLGAGLPDDVVFSHKIGEEFKEVIFLDSGIIYFSNRPCLITVMIEVKESGSFEDAKEIMKELSESVYTYVSDN